MATYYTHDAKLEEHDDYFTVVRDGTTFMTCMTHIISQVQSLFVAFIGFKDLLPQIRQFAGTRQEDSKDNFVNVVHALFTSMYDLRSRIYIAIMKTRQWQEQGAKSGGASAPD
jgi:hypothetical protein